MLETIYITRHGFRTNWSLDNEGNYSATILSPTGIPTDPPLTAYGVAQSRELSTHLQSLDPKITRIYSSAYYRCIQTINPFAEAADLPILLDNGIGDWFGYSSKFTHPPPATPDLLHRFFPRVDTSYSPSLIPPINGETLAQIHDRMALALARIIGAIDREWHAEEPNAPKAIILCAHAAPNIASGRVLTGNEDLDVGVATCSLSTYKRRGIPPTSDPAVETVDWRGGRGVAGGWDQIKNGDCSFLSGGEERNWWFKGDESWDVPNFGMTAEEEAAAKASGAIPDAGKGEEEEQRESAKI